eukprot:TRINITY_DN26895_c0_g1_i1.p1 TRINITY_DN26895_c0_g1~~TRINITY_DN26895_c0_g1_i1.p1  ORF type:complete len:646 (-),score=81.68 TRINITY_DN26895_c0_g1_i1:138-2075(-)
MLLPALVEPASGEDVHIPGFTRYGSFLNGFLGVPTPRSRSHRSPRIPRHASPLSTRSTTKEGFRLTSQDSAPCTRPTIKQCGGEPASAAFTPHVGGPGYLDLDLSCEPIAPQALGGKASGQASDVAQHVVAPAVMPRTVCAPTSLRRHSIGGSRPVCPGRVPGYANLGERVQRTHFHADPLPSLSARGEQEFHAYSAPASSRSFPQPTRRRYSMTVAIPGDEDSDADPAPATSRSFPLSNRRRHSMSTVSGRENDELVAAALSLNSPAVHRRGGMISRVRSTQENPNLGRRNSFSGISETELSSKRQPLEHDDRVKRQACKDLRSIILGSFGNEDRRPPEKNLVYEQSCGNARDVRSLYTFWSNLDPEASWEVTMDLVLEGLKELCAEDHAKAERCVRYLMDAVQRRNATNDVVESSPRSLRSHQCTPEDLMRVLWLHADEKDIRLMSQRMQLRYLNKMRVATPPLISADKLHEFTEEFRHLDRKGLGYIRYHDLLTAGFLDDCTLKELQGRYDQDGTGVLELSQFIDMRCPCGFRPNVESKRVQLQNSEFVSFVTTAELPGGHFSGWLLDETLKRLPIGLRIFLNVKALSAFASCTTRGLIQTAFTAWRALGIKDDELEGYSSDTNTSAASSFSSDDEDYRVGA